MRLGNLRASALVVSLIATFCALVGVAPAHAQRYILDPSTTQSILTSTEAGRFGACDLPLIDRGALPADPFGDTRLTPMHTLAGFVNFFRPGAQPFPCNHYDIRSWGGVLRFGLDARPDLANRRVTIAILNITEATAIGIGGVTNRSFCAGGGGCLRTTQALCRFQVGVLQQPTTASRSAAEELILSSPRFSPRTLASAPRGFTVSGRGGPLPRPIAIDVTREFRAWTIDRVEPGLVIYPNDSGVRTNDFGNDCRVLFRAHLDVFVND